MTTDDCFFAAFPLDPADHLRGDDAWLYDHIIHPDSRFLLYAQGRPLMDISDGLQPAFKSVEDMTTLTGGDWAHTDWVFLGLSGDVATFAVALKDKIDLAAQEKFIDLRSVALQVSKGGFSDMPSLLGRGKMLLEWNGRRHFCSCCGHKTRANRGGYVRKCVNEACGAEHFPRTDPVVIMMVTAGDKCLLGRGKGWPEGNFSTLAGFMEPGETIEEATRREVFEEAGIKVGKVTYLKSQPWPFPSSLMIGVQAEALTTEITLDTDELVEAMWMEKAELRVLFAGGGDPSFRIPPKIAIARHLLEEWLQHG
ncbi:MAG: NAD(+) diphosphatase [Alphaproteobacteria bacterium]|nr:MAG: NAD(+) diphosphatase [Alphaproteobacteria bacterium]